MGHLATKEEILKQLQKRLYQNPVGLPEHTSVYEILSILFTEKEAEVGAKFPFGAVTLEELQNVMGIGKDELEKILTGMTKKGLVVTTKKKEETRYLLSMGVTGFFEMTFMRTNESLPMKRLAELIHTYRNTPEFVREFFSSMMNRGRVYPYRDVLPQVKSEVLRFDEAAEHAVSTANYIAKPFHEECNGCGECETRCQINAIQMEGDYPVVDEEFCLGCGVCSHFCPSSAMKMEVRGKKIMPPKTYKDLMIRLMKEKGRL